MDVSYKAVLRVGGEVLLARNHRGEWELPGGRAEAGEGPETAVAREVSEECGLDVEVGPLVHDEVFEVIPGRLVRILAYRCATRRDAPVGSDEHVELGWFHTTSLPDPLPDVYRRAVRSAIS